MEYRVFIGWDSTEVLPWHVLHHSIVSRASKPVSVTPVKLDQLPLTRPPSGSTEFSLSRFLVPWMCGYQGYALFIDCDMLVIGDVTQAFVPGRQVRVVQHDYTPKGDTKFHGNKQVAYPRKNWSSVMLFDCYKCAMLTPEYVDAASPQDLHRMVWADDIGGLSSDWNHLVGEYKYRNDAKIVHWTNGGPWLTKYRDADYAAEWFAELEAMKSFRDDP